MPMMDTVTLENFRCFREKQTVRLAPLTLLVGENSTGKTSFLALLRAMADLAFDRRQPNFKRAPFDLGSFDDIAHNTGGRGAPAASFTGGFSVRSLSPSWGGGGPRPLTLTATFEKEGTAPVPTVMRIDFGEAWVEQQFWGDCGFRTRAGTPCGEWVMDVPQRSPHLQLPESFPDFITHLPRAVAESHRTGGHSPIPEFVPAPGSPPLGDDDQALLEQIGGLEFHPRYAAPVATGPIRSTPFRTYDPAAVVPNAEGVHVPMLLADAASRQKGHWNAQKAELEELGKTTGLFDEIEVRQLGTSASDPFQIRVRKGGNRRKGKYRNLTDVGYGVSQALPILTELLTGHVRAQFLIQQPEVHLHPSAQASLGSLFCTVAANGRQLIVETHSDHLIDRVRMDVRDDATDLKPDDVSLLFFERDGLDVRIHSLGFDEMGNVLNAPPGYRRFFLEEVNRSLGL